MHCVVLTRDTLACLADNALLAGKKCIVVGAKSDLARTRVVSPGEGCSLAMARTFTALGLGGSRGVSAPLRAAAAGDRIIS